MSHFHFVIMSQCVTHLRTCTCYGGNADVIECWAFALCSKGERSGSPLKRKRSFERLHFHPLSYCTYEPHKKDLWENRELTKLFAESKLLPCIIAFYPDLTSFAWSVRGALSRSALLLRPTCVSTRPAQRPATKGRVPVRN